MYLEVYAYGSGEIDQLGLGEDIMMAKKPKKILPNELFANIKINKIACGAMHTLILTSMGKVLSWGCNDEFALGRGGTDNLPGEVTISIPVNGICAGDSHSVAYSTELNKVFLWGSYRNREGGFGKKIEFPELIEKKYWKGDLKKVVSGANHTLLLSDDKAYVWGNPEFGQTGRDPSNRKIYNTCLKPHVLLPNRIIDIFTGTNHLFILIKGKRDKVNILKSWGLNNFCQLGHSNDENQFEPKEIEFFNDKEIKEVVGGDSHSMVLLKNGSIYVFGRNDENQLGFKDTSLVHQSPVLLDLIKDPMERIYSSSNYSYAISFTKQKIYSWGFGENYVLGNEDESRNETEPFLIKDEFFKHPIDQLSLGNQHVVIALAKGLATNNINELPCNSGKYVFDYDLLPYMPLVMRRKYMKKNNILCNDHVKKDKLYDSFFTSSNETKGASIVNDEELSKASKKSKVSKK